MATTAWSTCLSIFGQLRAPAWLSTCLSLEAALGMFEHGFYLLARDAGKPAQEIVDAGPVFQILKERLYRHPSPTEHPCTTDFAGYALYSGTRRPVQHGHKANVKPDKEQARNWR